VPLHPSTVAPATPARLPEKKREPRSEHAGDLSQGPISFHTRGSRKEASTPATNTPPRHIYAGMGTRYLNLGARFVGVLTPDCAPPQERRAATHERSQGARAVSLTHSQAVTSELRSDYREPGSRESHRATKARQVKDFVVEPTRQKAEIPPGIRGPRISRTLCACVSNFLACGCLAARGVGGLACASFVGSAGR
jgi:hypothetical protein